MYRIITLLLFLDLTLLFCQSPPSMDAYISAQKQSAVLKHASWALYAEYTDTQQALINRNSEMSLAPASCLKLFTTAAALEILGAEFRFKTQLYFDGTLNKEGVLNGNLIIRGGGDPTLGSGRVKGAFSLDELMENWTNAVKKAGIKSINGSVIGDASLFSGAGVPGNWLWIDLGNYYGAGVSALSIHDNLYRLFLQPGNTEETPVQILRTEPEISGLVFDNRLQTGAPASGDQAYIFRAPGSYRAILRGTVPAGVAQFSIKGSLPQPALFSAKYFITILNKNGIPVSGKALVSSQPANFAHRKLIHTSYSPPLSEIISVLNKRSVNLYAELLLRALSVEKKGDGSLANGLTTLEIFLNGLHVSDEGLHLEDGSGLSPNNLITAKMMVQLLKAEAQSTHFKTFYESLSLAGDPEDMGFFKRFGKNSIIEKKCRIKSGYIQGVRSHSGYVTAKSGRMIAFSFMANHFTVPYAEVDKIHEALLIRLAESF